LITELKLYTIKTHSLKKVFLGIKGIYYEMVAPGQGGDMIPVRWLEGYEFQQNIPHDVDFRILLTFVDLYRTLIKFVLFKLYTEENLVYPPPINTELEEQGENVGAMQLVEKKEEASVAPAAEGSEKKISKKEVKKVIKGIKATGDDVEMDVDGENSADVEEEAEEEFVERPSKVTDENEDIAKAPLTTYSSLLSSSATASSSSLPIFSSYTFYLSREIPTKTWEFIIKATGGRVITALQLPTLDSSSPSAEEQKLINSITHVVIDRPIPQERITSAMGDRKWVWVQPQWVADCINRNKIISSEEYKPGNLLPPHLSPWEGEGELSRPWLEENGQTVSGEGAEQVDDVELEEEDEEDDDEEDGDEEEEAGDLPSALLAASENPSDPTLVHAAELEAERNGISHAEFQKQLKELSKKNATAKPATKAKESEEDLAKIMMSNKKAKLYEKMKYGNKQKQDEVSDSWPSLVHIECPADHAATARQARDETQSHREEEEEGGAGIAAHGWRVLFWDRCIIMHVLYAQRISIC
jgi:pescadillo protein